MKKILTIILLIIFILGGLLGISWFIARKKAEKNNENIPTFREFLNWGTSTKKLDPSIPTNTTDFTPKEEGTNDTTQKQNVRISQFTSGGASNVNTNISYDNNYSGNSSSLDIIPAPIDTNFTEPECSDEDLNIEFTPSELARLKVLQAKFYAIADKLHTDTDANIELQNYDTFKTKAMQIKELYTYCQEKAPLVTDPIYQKRVPTPFWSEESRDSETFITPNGPIDTTGYPLNTERVPRTQPFKQKDHQIDLNDWPRLKHIIEYALRLNLW